VHRERVGAASTARTSCVMGACRVWPAACPWTAGLRVSGADSVSGSDPACTTGSATVGFALLRRGAGHRRLGPDRGRPGARGEAASGPAGAGR
jgi:hypothetical protein